MNESKKQLEPKQTADLKLSLLVLFVKMTKKTKTKTKTHQSLVFVSLEGWPVLFRAGEKVSSGHPSGSHL
jgi:hypothetical protein